MTDIQKVFNYDFQSFVCKKEFWYLFHQIFMLYLAVGLCVGLFLFIYFIFGGLFVFFNLPLKATNWTHKSVPGREYLGKWLFTFENPCISRYL